MYELSANGKNVVTQEIHELCSNQEEADSRVVLHLKYAETFCYNSAVVRTPVSDIFFLLLCHSHSTKIRIFLDTGTRKQNDQ